MSLRVFVIACVLVIVAATNSRAYAQSGPEQPGGIKSETLDEQVAKTLAAKRGVVLIGRRRVVRNANHYSRQDGRRKMQRLSAIGSASFFGKRTKYGAILLLVPVSFLFCQCRAHRRGRTVLNGPFAKFTVAAGEFVDVGVLKLDYKPEGFLVHPARCTNPS